MSQEKPKPRGVRESAQELAGGFVRFGHAPAKGHALVPEGADVRPFDHRNLQEKNRQTYHQIKSQFRVDVAAKASRFALSELVSNQLSVEAEEQRRFEKRVQEEVQSQLSIVRREAMEKAHREGLEKGRTEAFEAEKARLAQHMEHLASATEAIQQARNQLVEGYETKLVDVAFRLAELVVHHQVTERPEMIHATISAILSRIARDEDVRIRLSGGDFEAIEEIRDSLKEVSRSGRISYDVDSSLKRGDCVVESSSGEIGSFVEEAFTKLKQEMLTLMSLNKAKETGT